MIEHLVRRGLEHASNMSSPQIEMPKWGAVLLSVTFFISLIFISAVEYTLKDVLAALCMIETPAAAITISLPQEPASKDEKEGLLETAPTITLVHQKPITSSIRGSIRHLISQAGKLARWRGFRYHAIHSFAFAFVLHIAAFVIPPALPFRMIVVPAVSGAITANLHAAWTHKVVSMPSNMTFWQRVPSRSSWKVLAFPAAVNAAMPYVALYVVAGFVVLFGIEDELKQNEFSSYTSNQWTSFVLRLVAVGLIGLSCTLFLCLPAIVTSIRVDASILPDDQDTIVPFDRTFAGKVVPKILGGTGCVSFLDAWRSFNWEARRRLIKLYVKTFVIIAGLVFIVAHVLMFEMFAIMGPALGEFLAEAHRNGYAS